MNEDRILEMFFEKARWQYAIEKGLFKDMNKAVMYQLTTPEARLAMYQRIKSGNYKIMPPHTAKIPKDNGDFRTVYVNEAVDRILLSIANDLLFELMPEMVHPRCTSYQKGIGCGRVVQDVSRIIYSADGKIIGFKSDLSKYFDNVPIRFIDWAFDRVEEKYGKSALIDVIRDYYHTDIYFDEDNNLCEKYQSLKQGCSVAAWLADVVLYHIDEMLSNLDGYYVRYSDDILFVGKDYENTKARYRWFNGCVAYDMAIDYIKKLRSYIDDKCIYTTKKDKDGNENKTYKHTCKGNPYIRLQNEDIFVDDLERKVYNPLRDLANKMATVEDYKELYDAVREFNKNRKHLAWDTKQADAFITAYKGSGSYYTMRNLIMFHGARFMKNGRKMSETNSLKELESKAKLYDEEGWRMLGILKQLIKDNNISVQGKILEWKKAKSENK